VEFLIIACRFLRKVKTVLVIDQDLGFVFWIARALDAMHYFAVPARSVPDAALLIMQLDLKKVDLLMINLELSGGSDFISAMHRSRPDILVIGIVDDLLKPIKRTGVDVVRPRPVGVDEAVQIEWMEWIENFLAGSPHDVPTRVWTTH
jgi:ActR/RegA family two-component response regulator